MAGKEFKAFDAAEIGPETIIGGEARTMLESIPEFFFGIPHLIIAARPDRIEEFRQASAGKRLVIEVGAGKGRFISEMAARNPEAVCLGFETGLSLCGHALERADRKGLKNVFMAWGDARVTIPMLVGPCSADAAFLLFPDPWWKKKHASRRHGPVMGNTVADALKPGSLLTLKSDVEPYLAEIVAAFMSTGRYCQVEDPVSATADMPYTDREVRLRAAGTPVFTAVLVRN